MSHVSHVRSLLPADSLALVVDDSIPTRRIFRGLLDELGLRVEEADDGVQALDILEKRIDEFSLIFSDISMPRMDGFELCHRLQEAAWYDGTPFVLVSTENDAPNVVRGLKLGADDFMPKPFDIDVTAQVIERILEHD